MDKKSRKLSEKYEKIIIVLVLIYILSFWIFMFYYTDVYMDKEYYKIQMITICKISNIQNEILNDALPVLKNQMSEDFKNLNISADYILNEIPDDRSEYYIECNELVVE